MKQSHALEQKFDLTSTDCRQNSQQNNHVQHTIVKVLWNRVALFFSFVLFFFSLVFKNASYEYEKENPI